MQRLPKGTGIARVNEHGRAWQVQGAANLSLWDVQEVQEAPKLLWLVLHGNHRLQGDRLTMYETRCGAVCGPKEIRRHINTKHPRVKLPSAQLASVHSLQRECGKVVSSTGKGAHKCFAACLLYTSPSPRDRTRSRMPSSA